MEVLLSGSVLVKIDPIESFWFSLAFKYRAMNHGNSASCFGKRMLSSYSFAQKVCTAPISMR